MSTEIPFTCVTCEHEIAGQVVFHVGLPFCCAGCVANGPCTCSYDEPAANGAQGASHEAERQPSFVGAPEDLVLTAR
ncbi:MAG: hypothetical protein WEE50_07360 [Chloroflexota bacterium]